MVKNLYLLRHADAEVLVNGLDHERKLSLKGQADADALAAQLFKKSISFDVILCSTALRVRQTYDHIAASLLGGASPQFIGSLYNTDIETLLELVKSLEDSNNSVLIINHNPTISEFASNLVGEPIQFSPGVLKYLQLAIKSWKDITYPCAKLIWSIPAHKEG